MNQAPTLADRLASYPIDSTLDFAPEIQQAACLARDLMRRANELQTPQERRQQAELDRMIQHPTDKVTLTQLTDQAFRSNTPHRAVDQLVHILDVQGIPRFFTPVDRALLRGFQSFGSFLPGVAVPLVKDKMQHETANVVLPAERELLTEHLRERQREGVRMNVNYLGEALLGEDEAQNRLRGYLQALQLPEIEVISVKISTIYSQISMLATENTLAVLSDRLEMLYRAAAKATFTRADGTVVPKFVYLDMEEYRDMWLTAEAFMRTLERPGLEDVTAGLVLQAYIPDSFRMQRHVTEWARRRVASGGAPITLRIVKGANMEMERFEASVFGWPQAPYKAKPETDANYRRMVEYGMSAENRQAVRLGIASHNLFELAYGLVLGAKHHCLDNIQFEMLEGMANHQRRALFEIAPSLLLYAPACHKEDFIHAIGYLVRRLDENTGPDNFLRHTFRLKVDSSEWVDLEKQFFDAFQYVATLEDAPRRTQDRNQPPTPPPASSFGFESGWQFENEPDTDFSLGQNVAWANDLVSRWEPMHAEQAMDIPLTVAGETVTDERPVKECRDPSRPGHVVARYRQASAADVDQAIACAARDDDGWRARSASERRQVLRQVAQELRMARAELMGAALADGGKTLSESDPEVSEAVDFAEFYGLTVEYWDQQPGLQADGRGVVVVVSPWNFP
ncbi:MAG: bifunctional proline dehydrogenase/L-glutamate gamma-semialdehyde dehydrogenase, partial [Planctomycetota bacterium]